MGDGAALTPDEDAEIEAMLDLLEARGMIEPDPEPTVFDAGPHAILTAFLHDPDGLAHDADAFAMADGADALPAIRKVRNAAFVSWLVLSGLCVAGGVWILRDLRAILDGPVSMMVLPGAVAVLAIIAGMYFGLARSLHGTVRWAKIRNGPSD